MNSKVPDYVRSHLPVPFRRLIPAEIRRSSYFALSYSTTLGRHSFSVWLDGLTNRGAQTLREHLLRRLTETRGFPPIRLDRRTDPGAVKEVLVNQVYDYPGFLPNEDWIVLDVGAQHGDYSLLCSHIRGARVFAFEPLSANLEVMHANLALNPPHRVTVLPFALGSSDSLLDGLVDDGMFTRFGTASNRSKVKVEQRRLDDLDLVNDIGHGEILVKIDVEGFELDVLEGAAEFIRRFRPHIVIEVSPSVRREIVGSWLVGSDYGIVAERAGPPSSILFLSACLGGSTGLIRSEKGLATPEAGMRRNPPLPY